MPDYKQAYRAIQIAANYDASCVWAPIPIYGWKLYLGFRWSLTREDKHEHHEHEHHDHAHEH